MHILGNVPEMVTAIAAAITAVVAILAILEAKRQINASNRSQKEATAIEVYSGYLKLAIDHPEESRRDKYKQEERVSVIAPKYDAFVTYLLFAAEEVLDLVPDDKAWRHALKLDLSHHKEFFRSDAYKKEDVESYIPPLRDLIKEILLEEVLFEQRNEKEKSPQAGTGSKG